MAKDKPTSKPEKRNTRKADTQFVSKKVEAECLVELETEADFFS